MLCSFAGSVIVRQELGAGWPKGGSDKSGGIGMDSLITAAALALASGDPLGALNRIALRDDAAALALRGLAMAQLGDLVRAKTLLRRAARAFGPREAVARARCTVAEAEIALVSRDLGWPPQALGAARAMLEQHGDWVNAGHGRNVSRSTSRSIMRQLTLSAIPSTAPRYCRRRARW